VAWVFRGTSSMSHIAFWRVEGCALVLDSVSLTVLVLVLACLPN